MSVVVDASVWVAAADPDDASSDSSRHFLGELLQTDTTVVLPAFVHLEVACALARRLRDGAAGIAIANGLLRLPAVVIEPLDATLLERAAATGTRNFLRAADALYAAAADQTGRSLVSLDGELVERSGAMTPGAWLAVHGKA